MPIAFPLCSSGKGDFSPRVVGNGIHESVIRYKKGLTPKSFNPPYIKGEIPPCVAEVRINPLIPQPCSHPEHHPKRVVLLANSVSKMAKLCLFYEDLRVAPFANLFIRARNQVHWYFQVWFPAKWRLFTTTVTGIYCLTSLVGLYKRLQPPIPIPKHALDNGLRNSGFDFTCFPAILRGHKNSVLSKKKKVINEQRLAWGVHVILQESILPTHQISMGEGTDIIQQEP